MTTAKGRTIFGVLVMVFLLFIILLIFAGLTFRALKDDSAVAWNKAGDRGESIGVVEITGAIMDAKNAIELLQRAEDNDRIKAIIVRINSPGGAVAPTQEIYQEMRRIDQVKPIYVSMGAMAASGGYYLAAAARRIYANPGTLTGSIGVIMQFTDASKLYDFIKINPSVIKAGKYKDVGSPFRPMTDSEKAYLTKLVEQTHQQFIKDIIDTRKDKLKARPEDFAQGQIFTGEQALQLGLVDALASLETAAREIHKELKLPGKYGIVYVKKKKNKYAWLELFDNMEESIANLKEFTAQAANSGLMYLYRP